MACREWCYGMVKMSDSGTSLNIEPMGFIDGLIYVPGDETSNCLFLNSAIVLVKKSGKVNI